MKVFTFVIVDWATAPAAVEAFNVPLSSVKSKMILKPKRRVSKGAYHVQHTKSILNIKYEEHRHATASCNPAYIKVLNK